MSGRPFTPATLAEHLGCSERLIRNEIAAGRIRAFRVGDKLLRIEPEAVEEYKCRNTGSPDLEESGPSPSLRAGGERTAIRLARLTGKKPSDG